MTFMDKCVRGLAKISEINSYIEQWHRCDDEGKPLCQYLGITIEEFKNWVLDPDSIIKVFFIKRTQYIQELAR